MYPNPQDVLPLPERPSAEWYRGQARDLAAACRSGAPAAVPAWAAALVGAEGRLAGDLARYAAERLAREKDGRRCLLADAQFVVARAFGFPNWGAFAAHLGSLAGDSPASLFEQAADAIVRGEIDDLRDLLAANPGLIRARSTREHGATLLHYVAANGVENYRQKSPKNAPDIARLLLDAGAEVDAEADMYGGGATTLGLAATSVHPEAAGVQRELLDVLLEHGARLDGNPPAGNNHSIVTACLANGQPGAAAYLAERGARLDLEGAAGIGRGDVVAARLAARDAPPRERVRDAFSYACGYGQAAVVELMLSRGVAVDEPLRLFGEGHTGLHIASYHAHREVVHALLARGADPNAADATWKTGPLVWALQGYKEGAGVREIHLAVMQDLIRSGARVSPEWLEDEEIRRDPALVAALTERRT